MNMFKAHQELTSLVITTNLYFHSGQHDMAVTYARVALNGLYNFILVYVNPDQKALEKHLRSCPIIRLKGKEQAIFFNWMGVYANDFFQEHHLPKLILDWL